MYRWRVGLALLIILAERCERITGNCVVGWLVAKQGKQMDALSTFLADHRGKNSCRVFYPDWWHMGIVWGSD